MESILVGIITFFNLAVIKKKLDYLRYEDAAFDGLTLFALAWVFSGSYGGLVVATISSFGMSLFFLASPPQFIQPIVQYIKKELKDAESY